MWLLVLFSGYNSSLSTFMLLCIPFKTVEILLRLNMATVVEIGTISPVPTNRGTGLRIWCALEQMTTNYYSGFVPFQKSKIKGLWPIYICIYSVQFPSRQNFVKLYWSCISGYRDCSTSSIQITRDALSWHIIYATETIAKRQFSPRKPAFWTFTRSTVVRKRPQMI